MNSSGNLGHTPSVGRRAWIAPAFVVWVALLVCAHTAGSEQTTITFDRLAVGSMPPGFRVMSTSRTEPGDWRVTKLGDQHVLTQQAIARGGYRFALLERPSLEHLRVAVRLRLADHGDRAAGIAWRVQNADNYYVARLDLDEREFVLHKFVNGNRIRLSRLERLRLDRTAWHEILVQHAGDTIRVWLNGIPVASEKDKAPLGPGLVGLWMPADSACHFSRLWYEPLRPE